MSVWDIAILKILPSMCSVAQFCPTLCNPMDCSPPGSSVHGILLGKNIEVRCHFLLQGIIPTQGWKPSLLHCRQILHHCTTSLSRMVVLKEQTEKPGWGVLGRPGITAPISHISSWTLIRSPKHLFPLSIKRRGGEMGTGGL